MKKTLFICFSTSEGSVSDYFVCLSNLLAKQYRIVVISDRKYHSKKLAKNVIIKFWPSKRPTRIKDFIFYFKLLKLYKPIMTIAMFGSVNINIISSYLFNVKYRIAWIRSLSTQIEHTSYKIYRKSIVYKLSTNIITNSKSTAKDAITFYNINPKKVKVLANSVNHYYDDYRHILQDLSQIIYVGRLHKSKGIDLLINAFQLVAWKYKKLRLIIVGNGPEQSSLTQIAIKTGLAERIEFRGEKPKNEVLKEMKKSYACVIPSLSEAFGYVVIEAMSMKTCVIGSNNTGIKEIIKHKKTGLLFETGNHKDLAEKLDFILKNKKQRDIYAARGFKRFERKYCTKNAIVRDFIFFTNLIEK